MAKSRTAFMCNDCGSEASKWQGQCADCGAWNTLVEVRFSPSNSKAPHTNRSGYTGQVSAPQNISAIDLAAMPRVSTGMQEFDRVLGGGLVQGSAVLMGGHPGAGKSTLLLQVLSQLSLSMSCLYVTGEESPQQVAMRSKRLGLTNNQLDLLAETNVESIIGAAEKLQPRVLVVDSIQVVHVPELQSAPGGVSQVRESAAMLTQFAKQTGTILFIVGHVTKDGSLAGPKVLEHMIDCSLMLEGDNDGRFRTLRGQKNRFGAVNEIGIFAMLEQGLKEVKNPSSIFLSRAPELSPGSVVMVVWEGTRPLLVEIQALVDESMLGNPRRVAVGLDQNRLAMLLAVLHRHGGLQVGDQDVFVNVVGGVKVHETSADLALLAAIVSSFRDKVLPQDLIVFGEVGLSGEIRPVPNGQERLREAAKHGFKRAIVPKANRPKDIEGEMEVVGVSRLTEALESLI